MFNCGYADATGHIAYVYNAPLPRRAAGYDWRATCPGNTSATLWTELPAASTSLPRVVDPPSGFVQNCQQLAVPRHHRAPATPTPPRYPARWASRRARPTARLRAAGAARAPTRRSPREEFDALKFDVAYAEGSAAGPAPARG